MEWFAGGIAEAIQTAKAAKGIFCVVIVSGKTQKIYFYCF
jgi:hypothetical protein